jgi:hypothetical protein
MLLPMATMPAAKGVTTPPYLPFARFLESLDSIAACLPRQITRATWKGESPYTATLLTNTYGFLKLTDASGLPTPLLHRLASDRASRPEILRDLLQRVYGEILDAVQNRESPKPMDEALAQFRLSGATHRKAVSFLSQACRYAGLRIPSASGGTLRVSHTKTGQRMPEAIDKATSTTVQLRSGGEITLAGRFNPFTISPEDRKFIFKLVDQLSEYQAARELIEPSDSVFEDEVPF